MVEQVVATLAACVKTFSELDTFATALQNDSNMGQSQDDAESRVDKLCDLVEQMLLRDLTLKQRLVALEAGNGPEEPGDIKDTRLHQFSTSDADVQGEATDPISTNKQPGWQRNPHGFAFEEILMSSRAYRAASRDNSDGFSIISSAGRTASWSMLSGLSLSEVSHIGIQAIPIYATDITNKEHYDFSPSAPYVIQIEIPPSSSPVRPSRQDRLKGLFRGPQPVGPELLLDPEPPLAIFGVALADSINCAKVATKLRDEDGVMRIFGYLPRVIANAGAFLKVEGKKAEDIFATIGSPVRIRELQQAFESPPTYGQGFVWDGYTIHDAAGIILRYLKSLPEPIIPYNCYAGFIDWLTPFVDRVLTDGESAEALKVATDLIRPMPPCNRHLLLWILDTLRGFAYHSEINKMTTPRLISVFQPSIISGPPDEMDAEGHRAAASVAILLLKYKVHRYPVTQWMD
ncbi:Rho-GAP domain-containing protein [Fusarium sp. LHS14.1]|nr:Rho-GAP domain-containing protein [Fusarium sp. LHS14.1]